MGDFNKLPWQHWGRCWPHQSEADLNELHMLMLLVTVVVRLFFCNIIPILMICFCWDMWSFMVCLTKGHFSFYEELGWFKIIYILISKKFAIIFACCYYEIEHVLTILWWYCDSWSICIKIVLFSLQWAFLGHWFPWEYLMCFWNRNLWFIVNFIWRDFKILTHSQISVFWGNEGDVPIY